MQYPRNLKPFAGRLDVAPFASVLFLLVILLVLHSPLAPVPGVRVQLPTVDLPDLAASPTPVLVVALDQHELTYFEHQVVRESELRDRLVSKVRLSTQPLALLIQADESVKQGAILRLAALARSAGISQIVMETRPRLFPAAGARTSGP